MTPIKFPEVNQIENLKKPFQMKTSFKLPTIPTVLNPTDIKKEEGSFFDKNQSSLRSLTGLASAYGAASNLKDNIKTNIIGNTPYVYTNRSSTITNNNQANFRNFLNSRTGTPINSTQAFAKTLEADNKINLAESEKQDANLNEYNNRNMQVNAANMQMLNRNAVLNTELYNKKTEAKADAFTSYLQNLDTQELQKNMMNRDLKAIQYMNSNVEATRANGIIQDLLKRLNIKIPNSVD